jgi:outer membrane biosynthesis protein TonB
VFIFRKVVLANFRMVLALVAGFWFLLMMLIVDMLFESIGVSSQTVGIMEGAAKLLAMAMFTAAPFVALLDRLHDARVLVHTSRRMVLLRDIHSVREVPEEHERWDDRTEEPPPPEAREEEETAEDDAGPPPPDEVEPVEQEEAKVEKVSEEEKGEPPAEEEKPAEEKPAEEKPAEEKPAEEAEPSKPAEEEKPTK